MHIAYCKISDCFRLGIKIDLSQDIYIISYTISALVQTIINTVVKIAPMAERLSKKIIML